MCSLALLGSWQDATFDSSSGHGSLSQKNRGFVYNPWMAEKGETPFTEVQFFYTMDTVSYGAGSVHVLAAITMQEQQV